MVSAGQLNLFDLPDLEKDDGFAIFSDDGLFRWILTRIWDPDLPPACFLMCNPSTADAEVNDPTVSKCIKFAKRWGCGALVVANAFGYRSTYPRRLREVADPVGPENDRYLLGAAGVTLERDGPVIAAWGKNGKLFGRDQELKLLLAGKPLKCLKLSEDGTPWHPLYIRDDTDPIDFTW